MTSEETLWTEQLRHLRDEAYEGVLNNDPRILLEVDGGPVGLRADLITARLLGPDEQIVADWIIPNVEPELRMPIPERVTACVDSAVPTMPGLRVARYVLQSSYAQMELAPGYAPPSFLPDPPNFMCKVLFLRYRRRI
jgi:hypothetical protein